MFQLSTLPVTTNLLDNSNEPFSQECFSLSDFSPIADSTQAADLNQQSPPLSNANIGNNLMLVIPSSVLDIIVNLSSDIPQQNQNIQRAYLRTIIP